MEMIGLDLNEKFVISIDEDGRPVEVRLGEMLRREIVDAVGYLDREVWRLKQASRDAEKLAVAVKENRPRDEKIRAAAVALRASGEAALKASRLWQAVGFAPEDWSPDLSFSEVLREVREERR